MDDPLFPQPPRTKVSCPITGELVDLEDVDQAIDLYDRICAAERNLSRLKDDLKHMFNVMASSTAKTKRLQGSRREVKITAPPDSWDQKKLKDLWLHYPAMRDRYLRLERVGVQLVEYKKMLDTSGPEAFQEFSTRLRSANLGQKRLPTVTIEK